MMWGYGIGCGGGMILWWIGGLLAIGAVVYGAVRLARRAERRQDNTYYGSRPSGPS